MSKIVQFIKENIAIIFGTLLVYQFFLTIFCFTTENLVILAGIIVIVAGAVLFQTYKDTISDFLKKDNKHPFRAKNGLYTVLFFIKKPPFFKRQFIFGCRFYSPSKTVSVAEAVLNKAKSKKVSNGFPTANSKYKYTKP